KRRRSSMADPARLGARELGEELAGALRRGFRIVAMAERDRIEVAGAGVGERADRALDGGGVADDRELGGGPGAPRLERRPGGRAWRARPCGPAARPPAGPVVPATGKPATTRGSGRPASRAAARTPGPTCSASVRRPVIHVIVPSASAPAIRRMRGPSAPISTGGGAPQATRSEALTR